MDFPGEKLLIRLWETLAEKGIGSLLRPWQMRREGRASIDVRTQELIRLAQAEKNAEDIRQGRKDLNGGALLAAVLSVCEPPHPNHQLESQLVPQSSLNELAKTMLSDTVRREINVGKALLHAEASLENDPQEPPRKSVDDDWLHRWREYAGSVSSQELQSLWGKLLAGEVKFPGAYSLRTLDFLRNLSHSEAEHIARLSRFVVGNVIFRGDQDMLDREGITYGFLLEMQQLGVVSGIEAIGMTITWPSSAKESFSLALTSHTKVIVAKHDDPVKQLTLKVCQLTAVGRQVLSLGQFEPHEAYLQKVGDAMKGQGFEVELADYIQLTETEIRYFNGKKL